MQFVRAGRVRVALFSSQALVLLAVAACGGRTPATYTVAPTASRDIPAIAAAPARARRLLDWPEFGLDPTRANATDAPTGISAANVEHLRRVQVALPGVPDSSPIYLHQAIVNGAPHDVTILTTAYGKTVAVDANTGRILWVFTPPDYERYAGSSQITNASPLADPDRRTVYAGAPDGRIYRLALADGSSRAGSSDSQGGSWPVSLTRDPGHEKLAGALNIDGPYVVAATGGYLGDAPPYQGHVALIDRASGHLVAVWNSLCADRRTVITPTSCASSDSAIWARGGVVVQHSGRLLLATGNGPYNGRTDFGDSVVELNVPSLSVRQSYTPRNQRQLDANDTDLGSSAPALLSGGLVAQTGKDGVVRLLNLRALDGRAPGTAPSLGGELQRLPSPAATELFSSAAVWRHGGRVTLFMADNSATGAYTLRSARLLPEWSNSFPGSSPVVGGGLLYVYDPTAGGVRVYAPGSARALVTLACAPGHWNSPIAVDGHVIVPVGNANDHSQSGVLDIFSA